MLQLILLVSRHKDLCCNTKFSFIRHIWLHLNHLFRSLENNFQDQRFSNLNDVIAILKHKTTLANSITFKSAWECMITFLIYDMIWWYSVKEFVISVFETTIHIIQRRFSTKCFTNIIRISIVLYKTQTFYFYFCLNRRLKFAQF